MPQAQDVITLRASRYELKAPLAQSAYGLVWRADDAAGKPVALKFINRTQMKQATPPLQGRWFDSARREAQFLASLAAWDERHIIRLLDEGEHEGLPVMALELMGPDLARHLDQVRVVSIRQALAWTGQINQALAKVHQYGWLYLDLKPANVLTTGGGAVKLADFGTSRLRSHGPSRYYSGTASWQAPEQFVPAADGSYAVNERTDFFALGALLYYLVTGGRQLRFCQDCGAAYRSFGADAALAVMAAGTLPRTLHPDEELLFAACFAGNGGNENEATWCPAANSAAGTLALSLLRALLAPDPPARPAHALDISRQLAAIGQALQAPALPAGTGIDDQRAPA